MNYTIRKDEARTWHEVREVRGSGDDTVVGRLLAALSWTVAGTDAHADVDAGPVRGRLTVRQVADRRFSIRWGSANGLLIVSRDLPGMVEARDSAAAWLARRLTEEERP